MLAGKRILLVIGGGIAAFKALELIRLIRKEGGVVTPVLTGAAKEFVTPLTASALAAEKVYTDLRRSFLLEAYQSLSLSFYKYGNGK